MVPLADVFNHKAAEVTFSSDYAVAEIDDDVDEDSDDENGQNPPETTVTASNVSQKRQTVPAQESASAKQPRLAGISSVTTLEEPMHERKVGDSAGLPSVSRVARRVTTRAGVVREVPIELRLQIAIIDTEGHQDEEDEGSNKGNNAEKLLEGVNSLFQASVESSALCYIARWYTMLHAITRCTRGLQG